MFFFPAPRPTTNRRNDDHGGADCSPPQIDRLFGALQSDLVTLIAREAPVARDLRLITALLHVSPMIERMGDQCVNIAELLAVAGSRPEGTDAFQQCLLTMGRATDDALKAAGATLREEDLDAARALQEGDTAFEARPVAPAA